MTRFYKKEERNKFKMKREVIEKDYFICLRDVYVWGWGGEKKKKRQKQRPVSDKTYFL